MSERRCGARALGAVLGVAALAGCSSYQSPTLTVTGVTVRNRGPDAMVLEIALTAENPNEVALPLKEFAYSVSLDGRTVFSGMRSPEATLRRFGTQVLRIPAVVPATESGEAPTGTAWCRVDGTLSYTTPGELAAVLFEADVVRPMVGFVDERSVELGERRD